MSPRTRAWLTTTASRLAIYQLRRENKRQTSTEAQLLYDDTRLPPRAIGDSAPADLHLLSPALALEARVALTLRLVGD